MRFYGYRMFTLFLGVAATALAGYIYWPDFQVLVDDQVQPAGWQAQAIILVLAAIGLLMVIISLVSMVRRLLRFAPTHSR